MNMPVPLGVLAAPTADAETPDKMHKRKLREALLNGAEPVVVLPGGRIAVAPHPHEQPPEQKEGGIFVPKGKLAASFYWYENDPELLQAEVQTMTCAESPFRHFQLQRRADKRLSWLGEVSPGLLKGRRTYTLLAIYDHNHPHKDSFGGSIKVYMVDPDLNELCEQMPRGLPHTLRDAAGIRYLCTARPGDVKAAGVTSSDVFPRAWVTTSAVSALAWAAKWLSLFELYLSDEITYEQFAREI